jgi:hypothetical protein
MLNTTDDVDISYQAVPALYTAGASCCLGDPLAPCHWPVGGSQMETSRADREFVFGGFENV